jgi:hypothetical protein
VNNGGKEVERRENFFSQRKKLGPTKYCTFQTRFLSIFNQHDFSKNKSI